MLYSCPDFYPRSPCGERRFANLFCEAGFCISIHALLAESDIMTTGIKLPKPRFLSTLSLRRATIKGCWDSAFRIYFYPRSPCGERPGGAAGNRTRITISIHALLAESDGGNRPPCPAGGNFYPRSPCGERRDKQRVHLGHKGISIHALLAESDVDAAVRKFCKSRFLSTLSLRRATLVTSCVPVSGGISIHALLAESDY